jgi:hypothetical protein
LVIPNDTTFLCQVHENLKNPLAISIQGQLRNHHQVQDSFNDHAKFKFQNGLLYHDGLAWLQVFQAKHDALVVGHFGFNKIMELMFQDY